MFLQYFIYCKNFLPFKNFCNGLQKLYFLRLFCYTLGGIKKEEVS